MDSRRCTITPRVTSERWTPPEVSPTNGSQRALSRKLPTWQRSPRETRKRGRDLSCRRRELGKCEDKTRRKKKKVEPSDRDLRDDRRKQKQKRANERYAENYPISDDGSRRRKVKSRIKRRTTRLSCSSPSSSSSSSPKRTTKAHKLPAFALRPEDLAVSCKFLPSGKAPEYWPPELGDSSSESELSDLSDGQASVKDTSKGKTRAGRRVESLEASPMAQITSVTSDFADDIILSSSESLEGVATVAYVASPRSDNEDHIEEGSRSSEVSRFVYPASPSDVDLEEFCNSGSADETEPPLSVSLAHEFESFPEVKESVEGKIPVEVERHEASGKEPTEVERSFEIKGACEKEATEGEIPLEFDNHEACGMEPAKDEIPVEFGELEAREDSCGKESAEGEIQLEFESQKVNEASCGKEPADGEITVDFESKEASCGKEQAGGERSLEAREASEVEGSPEAKENSSEADQVEGKSLLDFESSPEVREDADGEISPTERFRALAARGLPPGIPKNFPVQVKLEGSVPCPADLNTANIPPGFPPGFLDHLPAGSQLTRLNIQRILGVKMEQDEDARSNLSAANTLPAGGSTTEEEDAPRASSKAFGPQVKLDTEKDDLQKKSLEGKLAALMVQLETDKSADTKKLVSSFWGLLTDEEREKVRETLPEIAKFAPSHVSNIPVATAIPVPKKATSQVACTLRIQNLSSSVKAQQLGAVFGQYKIVTVSLLRSKKTNALVGIVKLAHKSDQLVDGEKVKQEMDGKEIMGQKMKVTLEKVKKVVPALSSSSKAPVQVALEKVKHVLAPSTQATEQVLKSWRDRITFHGCVLRIAMNKMGLNDDSVRLWCDWMPQILGEMGNIGVLQNAVLDFSGNQITDAGAGAILWLLLRLNVHVGDLCFGSNLLTDDCAISFTAYIKHMKLPLRMLGLDNNKFGIDGIMRLGDTLATHPGYPLYDPSTKLFYALRMTLQHNGIDANELFAKLVGQDIRFCQREDEAVCKNRADAALIFIPDLVEDLLRNALLRNEFPRRDPRPALFPKTAAPRPVPRPVSTAENPRFVPDEQFPPRNVGIRGPAHVSWNQFY